MIQRILIIGSELKSCKALKYSLLNANTGAYYTLSVKEGVRYLIRYGYQLVVLDILHPDAYFADSVQLIRRARYVPILVLSASGESDHITQILAVADDYLHKPFDTIVYQAKVKALLRRPIYTEQQVSSVLSHDGTLMIDAPRRKVYVLENEIDLPRKQYELLYLLAFNEGQVFTHGQLLERIWGHDTDNSENTLYCQITKLRNSLNAIQGAPNYIKTKRGIGYSFESYTGTRGR